MANQIDADAGILRSAWTGRDDDALRLHCLDLGNGNLIVAANFDLRAEFPEILNQVVSKRIVVVENEDHWRIQISSLPLAAAKPELSLMENAPRHSGYQKVPSPRLMVVLTPGTLTVILGEILNRRFVGLGSDEW